MAFGRGVSLWVSEDSHYPQLACSPSPSPFPLLLLSYTYGPDISSQQHHLLVYCIIVTMMVMDSNSGIMSPQVKGFLLQLALIVMNCHSSRERTMESSINFCYKTSELPLLTYIVFLFKYNRVILDKYKIIRFLKVCIYKKKNLLFLHLCSPLIIKSPFFPFHITCILLFSLQILASLGFFSFAEVTLA